MLFLMIRIRVQAYGGLKDLLGLDASSVVLREGATVADLLADLRQRHSAEPFRGIAVSVNAEYASPARTLNQDDEVGLLPPVSGGSGPATRLDPVADSPAPARRQALPDDELVGLVRLPIDAQGLVARTKQAEDGAVVVFDGIVRNHSRGRRTLYLDYEAYEAMALKQMRELAFEARERFEVRTVVLVHRLGRLNLGETSVLIIVASAHRAPAFDACRWLIDTLKKTVPIWKKETFVDGAVWADGEPFPAELGVEGSDGS
jgi:MoaE-MoaD fusion protein